MAKHPKSMSTGGFNHPDGSPCTYDDVGDLEADGRLDVLHDVEHRLVAAVTQVEVDVAGEQHLHHVHLDKENAVSE